MKSFKTYSSLLLALTLLVAGCKKKEILTFGSQMDQFTVTDENGAKTYLGHAEEWIYWEAGDDIKANDGSTTSTCTLISGAGTLMAFFKSDEELNPDASVVQAVYPAASYGSSPTDLIFPATQTYRADNSATDQDSSFGRGALPMVAYDASGMANNGTLYFHVVAGILRLQLLSSTTKTIDQITFKEVGSERGSFDKQISGHFNVNDISKNAPYLTPTELSNESRTIVVDQINKTVGPSNLLTFYLPLPAITSASAKTTYNLRMTVKTTDGSYFVRDFKADIHRRNITMMPAINITEWGSSPSDEFSSQIQLVGSGTKDRPFQIYTAAELKQVRDAFASGGTVKINGQDIVGVPASGETDNATHFKIVRSDIRLVNSSTYASLSPADQAKSVVWTGGIPNFTGYMYFASSTAANGGITNESDYPLFESITSAGLVERVFVKGSCSPNVLNGGYYSPMCNTNNGTMIDCHNKCAVSVANNANIAGLCITNGATGKIIGGANEAALSTGGNVAGICFSNNGYVQGNFTLSIAVPQGANIGGAVFNNNNGGRVVDCQVSSNIPVNSTGNWGIVVFNNNLGATIDNCKTSGVLMYTINGSVGGICNVNRGLVKNCSNQVDIRASKGNVGGIAATMDTAAAEIYNCRSTAISIWGAIESNVATNCGGVVGQLRKGKIYNCYNCSSVTGATNSGGVIGFLANNPEADVQNCWSAQGYKFVGLYDDGAQVGDFCFSATLLNTRCNRIYNTSSAPTEDQAFDIILVYPDQTLGGSVDPADLQGQNCGVALNAWVSYRESIGDSRQYYTWTTTKGQRPVFNTGLKRAKTGRRR